MEDLDSISCKKTHKLNKWSNFLYFWSAAEKLWLRTSPWLMHLSTILQHNYWGPLGIPLRSHWHQANDHHLQSSLKISIKGGQKLPKSLLAVPTWKAPDFHWQFISHCDMFFISALPSISNSFKCLFSTCSENFSWSEKLSLIPRKFNSLLLLSFKIPFFLANRWWNYIPHNNKLLSSCDW